MECSDVIFKIVPVHKWLDQFMGKEKYGIRHIAFQIKILDCVIGRNPRRRIIMYDLLGFLPLALPKSLSETL